MSYSVGETFQFGLNLIADYASTAQAMLRNLLQGIDQIGRHHTPARIGLKGNFACEDAVSMVDGGFFAPNDLRSFLAPIPVHHFKEEIDRVSRMSELTLNFHAPLRCERPNRLKRDGATCFGDSLFLPDIFVQRAARRLQELGFISEAHEVTRQQIEITENRLSWLDISYGPREMRKALGGAVGRVGLHLRDKSLAKILVLGQYLRVGEKTRFGFGSYRIEELGPNPYACKRSKSLLKLAFESPDLLIAAEDQGLEQGRISALVSEVFSDTYEPKLPQKFFMRTDRPEHEPRLFCVPHPEDRALQTAVLRQIAPALDLFFEESSTAYRRGLGRHRAAQRLREAYRQGFHWAVRADIHRFFDSIDHAILKDKLEAYLADDQMVELIMKWVTSGSIQQGRGIPTGSPISPLLSNLFLDRFDEQIEAEGARLVRYADDFLILFRLEEDAGPLLREAQAAVQHLKLHLNEEKTQILNLSRPFQFLGYRFQHRDGWDVETKHTLKHVDDLGWEQAPRSDSGIPSLPKLPGEVEGVAARSSSILIVGPGVSWLGLKERHLVCRTESEPNDTKFPLHRVDDIVVLGGATLDSSLVAQRSADPVVVWLADNSGRLHSILLDESPLDNAQLLCQQVRASEDPTRRLEIARAFVVAKLSHYAALADVTPSPGSSQDTGTALRTLAEQAAEIESIDKLLGLEGAGAAAWYKSLNSRLDHRFHFERRVAPDAEDPINVLLNIGFTWLYRTAELLALQQGLAPSLGFLHQPRSGHAALASDLVEPFRHLVDRAVIVASKRLKPGDFTESRMGRYRLQIQPAAAKSFVVMLHESFAGQCMSQNQTEPRGYRHQLAATIRSLHRHLLDPQVKFQVFRHPY